MRDTEWSKSFSTTIYEYLFSMRGDDYISMQKGKNKSKK